jgi:uncharacterized protein HemX
VPEETKKEDPKTPALEDFKGVLGWVESKKKESQSSGKPWGWLMGLIAALVVFIALSYSAYVAWKKGREIAKLKHKIDVDKEGKTQAEVNSKKLDPLSKEAADLREKAKDLESRIENNKDKIKSLEEERKSLNNKIDKITSWEDLDNL